MSNKILTKDEEIYEMARDLCRLGGSCEECSVVGTRNRDNCKAKIYARRAYEKGYKKHDGVPITFTFTEEQIKKMTEDIKERFEVDIKKVESDVAHEILQKLVDKSTVNNYCTAIVTLEDVIKVISEYTEVENDPTHSV